MISNTFCPISNQRTDEHTARIVAGFVSLSVIYYLLSANVLIIAFLLVDFILRSISLPAYSPLAILSKIILKATKAKPNLINAGPKIFAARIGVVFNAGILLFSALNISEVAIVLASIFALCAILEATIGFCVACKIYPFFYKLVYRQQN